MNTKKETILNIEFPIFNGKKLSKNKKETKKYKRIDFYYKENFYNNLDKINNYVMTLSTEGFIKKNEIKYEKQNGYVIIEEENYYTLFSFSKPKKRLHIVFHVNK